MPFDVEVDQRTTTRVEVRPTAVYELAWLLHTIDTGDWYKAPAIDETRGTRLQTEVRALFGDSRGCEVDLSILAERVGLLFVEDIELFFDAMPRAIELDNVPMELLSEPPEDRQSTIARLGRLRREPDLARRYLDLLRRTWELAREEWESAGLAAVRLASRRWTERLERGTSVLDLLPERHILNKREKLRRLLAVRPHVVVSPMFFIRIGGFVVDMTTFLHVGTPAGPVDVEQVRRKQAELTAEALKVLADATRLSILHRLAAEPASVTELARRFELAQPTISNHIRMLRDAGLLDSQRDGARVLYTAPRERVERLLEDARRWLLDDCDW